MLGIDRKFILKCYNEKEWNLWKERLDYAINTSIGKKKKLTFQTYENDISNLFDFWRFLRLPELSFMEIANTGDLLIGVYAKK